MIFVNNTDGLWGGQLDLPKFPWLRKVVVEYLVTRDQSGQFHFIDFDHDLHPGVGGGGDDYRGFAGKMDCVVAHAEDL